MAPEESSSAGGGKGSLGAGGGAFCTTGGGGSRTTSRWYRQPLLAVAIARAASVTSFPGIVMAAFLPHRLDSSIREAIHAPCAGLVASDGPPRKSQTQGL